MVTIALIPARGNSKGIARKNIKLFNSKPLIYWSIQTALKSNYIDRVVVTTEDEETISFRAKTKTNDVRKDNLKIIKKKKEKESQQKGLLHNLLPFR